MARGFIKKRGKNYTVIYPLRGKRKWEAVGPSKREAQRVLTERLEAINKGTYRDLPKVTFQEFAEKWLREYCRTAIKPSTLRGYQNWLRKHLIPFFGYMRLADITPEDVQTYVSEKLDEGKLSPKSINNSLVPLKKMLTIAVRWGYLRSNPARYVEKPRENHQEMDFLTPDEVRLFLENVSEEFYPFFLTAVMTGMRRGELLGLQWGDIDWENGMIHVRRSLWGGRFQTPKSRGSLRAIVMSSTLAHTLKKYRLRSAPNDKDLVFASRAGTFLDGDNLVKREFLPALRRAGLRKIRFHDLRHTYVTMLIAQGENVKFIQSQVGHASIQTTLDRYGHVMPETNASVGERLDATLGFCWSTRNGSKTVAKPPKTTPTLKVVVPGTRRAPGT
ncbi:MAG: site-specific integrase [Candidatus Eisenbacteria sp.]|nr:site-specific integrase [Candidatus Eisenbacteria bacterium]